MRRNSKSIKGELPNKKMYIWDTSGGDYKAHKRPSLKPRKGPSIVLSFWAQKSIFLLLSSILDEFEEFSKKVHWAKIAKFW